MDVTSWCLINIYIFFSYYFKEKRKIDQLIIWPETERGQPNIVFVHLWSLLIKRKYTCIFLMYSGNLGKS